MKQLFRLVTGLFCIVVVLLTVKNSTVMAVSSVPTPTPTEAREQSQYVLPYPGILPDSVLYGVKTIRDRIIEVLITKPGVKAEFYILQADKQVAMGGALMERGKTHEADEIFAVAGVSRMQAVRVLERMQSSGASVPPYILERLTASVQKHREVLFFWNRPTTTIDQIRATVARVFSV